MGQAFLGHWSPSLNDLWHFDGSNWTWVSGSKTVNAAGAYGIKGLMSGSNVPGARLGATGWTDSAGMLWLYGGAFGNNVNNTYNDLWRFDTVIGQWAWVAGSNTTKAASQYATAGVTSSSNVMGARYLHNAVPGSAGQVWLLNGAGYDVSPGLTNSGKPALGDVWRLDY